MHGHLQKDEQIAERALFVEIWKGILLLMLLKIILYILFIVFSLLSFDCYIVVLF